MSRSFTFAGLELHPDGSVRYGGEWQNTSSCHAMVETAGTIRDRATLTRVVGGALVAGAVGAIVGGMFRKRVDDTQTWLIITGEKDWAVPVPRSLAGMARQFAAVLNNEARALLEAETTPAVPAPVPSTPRRGVYQPGLR